MAKEAAPGSRESAAKSVAKSAARKRDILHAAARVFRAKGVTGTRMKDIADELGAAVGHLYYYFKDKQALLAFCQEDGLEGLLEATERAARLDLGPAERLYLLVVGHVVQVNESTRGGLAHLEVEGFAPDQRERLTSGRQRYQQALRAVIEDGRRRGVFRPEVDAKIATLALLGAVNWTVRWFDAEGPKSAAQVGRLFADHLIRGLLAEGVPFIPPPTDAAGQFVPPEVP